ncbi:hypothetical protein Belba_2944 [Belliella baltica DSM 15883]|uniref:Lipoprotein n=1 Tax=Belliella baltica (strain DSM 15883 / CIP 108006 / LMG 21964 / BA134) TaxID=866536 RepID=I3Z8A6_BELBD|nr:hypothetical protein [Belliella baltica]AFL85474.1 hypothetical protein Belba_2944 [Belliella baltica DSM 15883]
MFKLIQYSFLFAVILFSCDGKSSHEHEEVTDENLISAHEILEKSLDIREELLEVEKQLKDASIDYIELKEALKTWDKDISEVPGFDHSHDDEIQRKYHIHNTMKEFSPEEHKLFQEVMFSEIEEISIRMKRLMAPEVMNQENT